MGTLPSFTLKTPTEKEITVITYVSISIAIVVGIALGIGLLVYFMCRKKGSSFPPEFKYHAFIIYNKGDSLWVNKELLPFLEEEHNIKCCIHYRDFLPGVPFTESMAESVGKSYKIIAVFSSNFLQSNYCDYELNLAQYRLLNRRDHSLIIIRIDKTDPSNLPRELRKRSFIDYADAMERPFWKAKLLKFLNSGSESVTVEQERESDIGTLDEYVDQNGYRQTRTEIDKLELDTSSNATEISIVTFNEERFV
ncbi:toll-like receptor 1 [Oculina patagonica]